MTRRPRLRPSRWISYLLGLLLLAAVAGLATQHADLERFLDLVRHVQARWLLACLLLQAGTYLAEAVTWKLVLGAVGFRFPMSTLVPLCIAKLFSDQAMPSAGISGSAFFLSTLRRRGVAAVPAMSCMLTEVAAHFSSYAALAMLSLLVRALHRESSRWLLLLTGLFVALQLAVPIALWYLRRHPGFAEWRTVVSAFPLARAWLRRARRAAGALAIRPGQFLRLMLFHGLIMFLDTASLWCILEGIGRGLAFRLVFSSFITASMVASLSPIPLGLGSFEATCVLMLRSAGASVEEALAATILFRGVTVWLPMLPGISLIRSELFRRS